MCKAREYTNKMIDLYGDIKEDFELLTKELSELDSLISDIKHAMEMENFSASRGYELAKMQQEALRKRRKVKNEMQTLHPLVQSLSIYIDRENSRLEKKEKSIEKQKDGKLYRPRTEEGKKLFNV